MILAQIISQWTAGRKFQLLVDYPHPGVQSIADVTGQARVPGTPNGVVAECLMDGVTYAAIEADPRYDGAILWSEEIPNAPSL